MDHARHAGAGEGTPRSGAVLLDAWVPAPAPAAADRWAASPRAGADVHEEPWQRAEREQHARYG